MVIRPLSPEPGLSSTLRPSASERSFSKALVSASLSFPSRVCAWPPPTEPPPTGGALRPGDLHQRLDLAHGQVLLEDAAGERLGVLAADQRAGVAGGELAGPDQGLHALGQLQQPQRVGEMAAALADGVGDVLLGVAEALDQLVVAGRLLDRVEVLALHVLDHGELGDLLVGEVAHDDGHGVERRLLRRAPAPLAGDDLVAAAVRVGAGDDRLHQALGAQRVGEIDELEVVEVLARVEAAGVQLVDGDEPLLAVRGEPGVRLRRLADQRGEPAAEPALVHRYGHRSSPIPQIIRHLALLR